ncbi:MAG: NAD-glutamate dehydrogenase [Proteobacteria bacterium]|nr:NAD-glutamate dehydrogenase [Pseudomonadota bacterium]
MPPATEQQKADLIKKAITESRKLLGKKAQKQFAGFLTAYFDQVPPQDILGNTPKMLCGLAHSHWKLIQARTRRKPQIRVYNPDPKKDGWQSAHTVIEVVNDDMPFLVDSVSSELNNQDLAVHLVIHPIFMARRNKAGKLLEISPRGPRGKSQGKDKGKDQRTGQGKDQADAAPESLMHFQVNHQSGERLKKIEAAIKAVLNDIRASVTDWRAMRGKMTAVIGELESLPKAIDPEEAAEIREFLRWIHANQYTFLGYRAYHHKGSAKNPHITIDKKSGLGLLRSATRAVFREIREQEFSPRQERGSSGRSNLLLVTKANQRSTVHRAVHMDVINIKRFDKKGRVTGQHLFVGLFTSDAYSRSPLDIPLLRRRLANTLDRSGFEQGSHNGKALSHILETFPRDELFQVSDEYLLHTSLGILHLQDRQRVALFVREDDYQRFISCLIFIPRDNYTMALRLGMQKILTDAFAGEVAAHHAEFGDQALARLHLIIRTTPGKVPSYTVGDLEKRLVAAARSWSDRLSAALVGHLGEEQGLSLLHRYADAFDAGYREHYDGSQTLQDIDKIEILLADGGIGMTLYRPDGAPENRIRFKVYHPDHSIPLSDALPLFEHMGFRVVDEMPHEVRLRQEQDADQVRMIMIHDFGLESKDDVSVDLDSIRDNFQDAFVRVWRGDIESDGFNALVSGVGLTWREVVILRAYAKYLRQAGIAFSQAYMEQTLAANAKITRRIVDLFTTMFDPASSGNRDARANRIKAAIAKALDAVVSADEDRILRRFLNAVDSTLRTNFYQTTQDGGPKPYLSFKLKSREIEELPLPRPLYEIFVYSPRVEGIHLRFGMVARGGLRWSDRREDFRTEILGLVKAQQVKNAVIVPVGSKGGFVVKRPPQSGGRDAFLEEGIACYKILISGLFDLTDNYQGTKVTSPKRVVRRDGNDPYLVVAADKGTATFSDIANGVSKIYGHWLGDAFASGGSQGYDHKAMGITARGGWESVKRHFREIGVNIQQQDFTVVGVGDMSGDVFGNGMLLSKHIKLVGAFNHLHIFIDPDPDPSSSLAERKRMFKLPRSNWSDYDKKLISKGGGIFERSAKSLSLSPEIRKLFDIPKAQATPNELMGYILRADADLMWFGGIGTYVKAGSESNLNVGDRANDAIRINGAELRCKVVGEGANLGTTQLGRVEYALKGGRLNTDSIDNSAGVDCSDHEVNIKILIDAVVDKGRLSVPERNRLLASMTSEVGGLVLRHNYLQTQAITMVEAKGSNALDNQTRLMRMLERTGRLNRGVEFLPDDEILSERGMAGQGLTRPEIAIIMSYGKIWLYDELLASTVPDDPWLEEDLVEYFPTPLRKKYLGDIRGHRLRREIVATRATNSMINRVGGTFVNEFMEKTGKGAAEIARAYIIAREVFGLRKIWEAVEKLDNRASPSAQTAMALDTNYLIEWVTLWFLRNGKPGLDIGQHIQEFQAGIITLADGLAGMLPAHYHADIKKRAGPYVDQGVPEALALRIANLVNLYSGCDIVRLANRRKLPVGDVARIYFAIGTHFHLGRLRAAADGLGSDSHWQKLAVAALTEEIYGHQLALANQVLDFSRSGMNPEKAVQGWLTKNRAVVEPTDHLLSELWATEINDVSMIAVASRSLRTVTDGGSV